MNMGCQKGKLGFNEYNFLFIGVFMFVGIGFGGLDAGDIEGSTIDVRNGSGSPLMVGLTLIKAAARKGAVCLDGSLPGYHLDRGSGSGRNNWLVHFEGGGWCNDMSSCVFRKTTSLGSSRFMEKVLPFTGILSNNRSENPDFYNWNRVKLRYCDGASFTGDANNGTNIYFRGQRIWKAAIEDLLSKGMENVDQALLSGCSAGGLSSILHCDEFQELLPKSAKIKCFSDAGFFLDTKDISGASTMRTFFEGVVTLQDAAKNLPRECTSRTKSSQCFFPQYLLPYIRTPLFILNSAYDAWQVYNSVAPEKADLTDQWHYCKLNIANCTSSQLEILQGFRMQMLSALKCFKKSKTGGMFINSCFLHCQSELQHIWYASDSPRLQGKTIAESVGDWYFGRLVTKLTDCAYPCDGTCPLTPVL